MRVEVCDEVREDGVVRFRAAKEGAQRTDVRQERALDDRRRVRQERVDVLLHLRL